MKSVHFVIPEGKLRKYSYSVRLCSVTSHLKSETLQVLGYTHWLLQKTHGAPITQ